MSEAERKRRLAYKQNRRKWMMIQLIALLAVAALLLGSAFAYYGLNKTYYIDYAEGGEVDYKVQLKPNDFYDETWLGKDQAYVSSLIDNVLADFVYELGMNAENVSYDYTYLIEAQLVILDNDSKVALFDPIYSIKEATTHTQNSSNNLVIRESVVIDYEQYNELAKKFIETYDLDDTTSTLTVRMKVDVVGACEEFEEDSANSYTVALNIPLTSKTLDIEMTSTVPAGESKVLACQNGMDPKIFLILSIVFAVLLALQIGVLVGFALLTRNEDINYSIKVKKLVANYRSYIQQISNEFDTRGYQLLYVSTFGEMLGIRDTIQSPVLMYENGDHTCTRFLIPTNTKLLYVFEIKVEDYDEIYKDAKEEAEEEPVDEVLIVDTTVAEADLIEAMETPDVHLEEIDFVDEIDEAYEGTEEHPGVEVIGVVWPERAHKNKIYRYDPNGEELNDGDVVLVPSRDVARNRDIVRKAAVAHGNHKVDPDTLHHPLKKIIGVVKHKAEQALSGKADEEK